MYEYYVREVKTLKEVGKAYGLSGARIGQLFKQEGLRCRSTAEITALKTSNVSDEWIIEAYKEMGSVNGVMKALGLSRTLVSQVVGSLEDRVVFQARSRAPSYMEQDYLEAIRRAAEIKGEPLSLAMYREVSTTEGLPSVSAILHYFYRDDQSAWNHALSKAGVKGNATLGPRSTKTPEVCIQAVREYMRTIKGRPTYGKYSIWASENGRPSGSTVRNKVGWNKAVEEAQKIA